MLNNLLDILPGDGSWWAGQQQDPNNYYFNNIGEAALYAIIGLVVVFVGIVVIIAIIWLLGLLLKKTNNLEFLTKLGKGKKARTEQKPAEVQVAAAAETSSDEIPDEVKAAIIAAIMAYYQQKEDKCQFTVKRIKRM